MRLSGYLRHAVRLAHVPVVSAALLAGPVLRSAAQEQDLSSLSLEQLMAIEVTSVARKQQKLMRTAAAVYVITAEDIRRSGLRSIPELLRMAPGLHVAQIDGNKWAITSRGFNGRFASKMLVLIDGRSVYTPLFSGVYWEMHDLPLEDIERIEVIRGPGATMWGANAVNGVINIITKSARDTQGGLVTGGGGSVERGYGGLRYGGRIGENIYYRFYSRLNQRDELRTADNGPAGDAWRTARTGARLDWDLSKGDSLTVLMGVGQGDYHQVADLPTFFPPARHIESQRYRAWSGDALARWTHRHRGGADSTVQIYYDGYERNEPLINERRHTVDLEFQRRSQAAQRHEITWGLGYRYSGDRTSPTAFDRFVPADQGIQLSSVYLQDEITLAGEELLLTLGSKLEHNSFTGFEIQPTARLLWEPRTGHTFWTALSRAVRTPSRGERGSSLWILSLPPTQASQGLPTTIEATGVSSFESQNLVAFEGGYRSQPFRHVTLDLAVFYNRYSKLRSQEPGNPTLMMAPVPHLVLPLHFTNHMAGRTWGAEVASQWEPVKFWKLGGSYSWLGMDLRFTESASPGALNGEVRQIPTHQANAHSYLNLPGRLELDLGLYATSRIPATEGILEFDAIPAAVRTDVRLGWSATRRLEFSVAGQNLLDDRRPEFNPYVLTRRSEVRRGFHAGLSWRF